MQFIGPLGVGLWGGVLIALNERRKLRKKAASGDEAARTELTKGKTIYTVVAPIMAVMGACLLAGQFYLDYQKARTPLTPEQALERAMKNAIKNLPAQK